MKRTYSKEFKVNACELVLKDGLKVAIVAEKFGISHIMLHRWISEYQEQGEEAFVGKGHQRPADAALKKLQKENERLRILLAKQEETSHTAKLHSIISIINDCKGDMEPYVYDTLIQIINK